MKRDRRHEGRRVSDHCTDLLENPDIKTLRLAGQLLELPADKQKAIEMYVQTLNKLMPMIKPIR